MRVPVSPYPHQQLALSIFLTIAILVSVKWYLTVVLICSSLMANSVDPLFMCFLAICIPSHSFLSPLLSLAFSNITSLKQFLCRSFFPYMTSPQHMALLNTILEKV